MFELHPSAEPLADHLMATIEENPWAVNQFIQPVLGNSIMTDPNDPFVNGNIAGPAQGMALPGMFNFGGAAEQIEGINHNTFLNAPLYEDNLINHDHLMTLDHFDNGNDASFSTVNTSFNSHLGASSDNTLAYPFNRQQNMSFTSAINSSFTDYADHDFLDVHDSLDVTAHGSGASFLPGSQGAANDIVNTFGAASYMAVDQFGAYTQPYANYNYAQPMQASIINPQFMTMLAASDTSENEELTSSPIVETVETVETDDLNYLPTTPAAIVVVNDEFTDQEKADMELCLDTLDTLHAHIVATSDNIDQVLDAMRAKKEVYKDRLREVHATMVSYGFPVPDTHIASTRMTHGDILARNGQTDNGGTASNADNSRDRVNRGATIGHFPRGTRAHKIKIHYERVEKKLHNRITGIEIIFDQIIEASITLEDHLNLIGEIHNIGWNYRSRVRLTSADADKFEGVHAAHDAAVLFLNDIDSATRMLQHTFVYGVDDNDDSDDDYKSDSDDNDHDGDDGGDKNDGDDGEKNTPVKKGKSVTRASTKATTPVVIQVATPVSTRASTRVARKVTVTNYEEDSDGEDDADDEDDADYEEDGEDVSNSSGNGIVGGAPVVA